MIKNENASLSIKRIAGIAILFVLIFSIGVMATELELDNVKSIISSNYEMNTLDASFNEEQVILAKENSEVSIEQLLDGYTNVIEKIITEQVEIPYEITTQGEGDTSKVTSKGEIGIKEVTYKVKLKNNEEIEKTVISENIIKQPVNEVVNLSIKVATSRGGNNRTKTSNSAVTASSTLAKKVEGKTPIVKTFNTSAYCSCSKCCGKTNGITSSGAKASSWYTIAAGGSYPIGTVIYIPYFKDKPNGGWFVVQDRGGAISNNKIDVYMGTHSQALQFGRRSLECYVYM